MDQPITPPALAAFLEQLYEDDDPLRREMEALAAARRFPIIGPLCGRALHQLARISGARRVFELGSGYGYSALHFARAVGPAGEVHCSELDPENIALAERFLRRAGVWSRVTYHEQEATAALRAVGGQWDVIYNDIDKHGYPETVELAHAHLRPGGLFISDNVLWYGRVLPGQHDGAAATDGIVEFNRRLFAHRGFLTTIIPLRDGLAVALKL